MAPPPRPPSYSIVALKRWSCRTKEIPAVADIKHLHVYDFDNTLFSSPLPNPQLWAGPTLAYLQTYECFANGGWWHDPGILSATGEGLEKEEPRAWKGWWNEAIVRLVDLSMKQKDALTILLTGRGETLFADIVKRMVDSKGLDFDLICLKPEVGPNREQFNTTSEFKNEFLKNLVFTYKQADEIRIYEDRPKHVKFFREYFEKLNKSLLSHPIDQPPPPRKPITADVIQVAELNSYLDPVVEASTIQSLVNKHNTAVTKDLPRLPNSPQGRKRITSSYIYFGYLINPTDSARLITLANIQPPTLIDSSDIRLMANSILIAPRPPDRRTLERVGGRSKKLTWQVTGTAVFENKIWAVRVGPVPETERYWTNDPVPVVVLAVRKGARPIDAGRIQNWQPVPPEKAFIFETVVGDKQILRVEAEDSGDERYEPRVSHRGIYGNGSGFGHGMKRKFGGEISGYQGGKATGGLPPRIEDRDAFVLGRDDGSWMPQDRGPGHPSGNSGRHGGRGGGHFHNSNKQNENDGRRQFSTNRGGGSGGSGAGSQGGRGGGISGRGGGGASNNSRRNDYSNNGAQGGGGGGGGTRGRGNDRRDRGGGGSGGGSGGGGGRGRTGNRGGPPAYKSLDDYGPAGYDGPNDYRGSGTGAGDGQVVMNY